MAAAMSRWMWGWEERYADGGEESEDGTSGEMVKFAMVVGWLI